MTSKRSVGYSRASPRGTRAASGAYIESSFAVTGRSIAKSSVAGAFNQSFAAAGPFSGYRPYADATGPAAAWRILSGAEQLVRRRR